VSPSRYRYTGQERDEETGLGYHGARYYASWLGRWTAADPIGLGDGPNRFAYASGRPTGLADPSGTSGHSPSPDRPTQVEYQDYSARASDHNLKVETFQGQLRMSEAMAENDPTFLPRLQAEGKGLNAQEAELWTEYYSLWTRTQIADIADRRAEAYENGGPEFMNFSGRTRARIGGAAKLSLGVTLTLAGGPIGARIGSDFLQAGTRQTVTGDQSETLLRSGTALASEAMGSSSRNARIHGDIVETFAPALVGGWQAGAAAGRPLPGLGSYGDAASLRSRLESQAYDAETFERVVSHAELEATQTTGLLRGGRSGENFFTNSASLNAKRAQLRLGLDGPLRDARIRFQIKNDVGVTGPRQAKPGTSGSSGGGREFSTNGPTEIRILRVDPLRN